MFRIGDIIRINDSDDIMTTYRNMSGIITNIQSDSRVTITAIASDGNIARGLNSDISQLSLEIEPGRINACSLLEI